MLQQNKFFLMTKDEFKNWLEKTSFKRVVKTVQLHHTYIPNYSHFKNNYFQLLNSMEKSQIARGFNEIGQNITIFPDGMIAICRSFEKTPAGIKGANTNSICIENIGNFDVTEVNSIQAESIIFVVSMLCIKYKINPNTNTIIYHHWFDLNTGKRTNGDGCTKTCPGKKFFGGNTVEACNKNFIPLIINKINQLKQPQFLTPIASGIITPPLPYSTVSCLAMPQNGAKVNGILRTGAKVNIYSYTNDKKWCQVNQIQTLHNGYGAHILKLIRRYLLC